MAHRYMNKVVKQKVRVPIISRHLDRWLTLAHIGVRRKNWNYALVFGVFLMFMSFKTGSTVYVLGEAVVAVQWRDGSRTLRTCLWRVSYGSRHSRWSRRCASLDKAVLAARQRRDGIGLYALVFGVFPMVHVIQYGLDGARPSEVVDGRHQGILQRLWVYWKTW